jgi:uncharacterized coiled-coil protein SlyX
MEDRERLTRLEERYAHLQRHVTEQDKAMLALGDELARLRTELAVLRARQNAGSSAGEPGAAEERPPHY